MKKLSFALAAAALAAASQTPASAQMSMPSMPSMPSMSSMGGMGGMSLPSLGSASPTNIAGLLEYCVKNNYLSGDSATTAASTQSSLLSKFTGSPAPPDSNAGYASGADGAIQTGNGQTTQLGGTGIQSEITQKACSEVLSHGKSLL